MSLTAVAPTAVAPAAATAPGAFALATRQRQRDVTGSLSEIKISERSEPVTARWRGADQVLLHATEPSV
jgi:hypothetical protein